MRAPEEKQERPAQRSCPLDVIACRGCSRRFATEDGPGMIAAIKGPCPDCGGEFELLAADPREPAR